MNIKNLVLLGLAPFVVIAGEHPVIETFEGQQSALRVMRDGQEVQLQEGDDLLPGDQMVTQDESVTIAYPDQTSVTLSENSTLKISASDDMSDKNLQIEKGSIHSKVTSDAQTKRPYRMVIKGSYATIGVRGTEFTVEADSENNEINVHTLEGVVEAAQTEDDLKQNRVTTVPALESLRARRAQAFEKRQFRRDEFLKRFQQRHPKFMRQIEKPRRPFMQLRQKQLQRRQTIRQNQPHHKPPHRPGALQKIRQNHKNR